ncbi:hypothetical protein BpHYR1_033098 [Brachionus plicatilis]|uniref:Uncharacterized protein n=1 Tax=Brachionus plicatilis TaxID=10195 RepID=A0A3M7Q0H9_BRAPC|nr:hypothetical protein BpHYR1_033098 [Brachionus plicatilis]
MLIVNICSLLFFNIIVKIITTATESIRLTDNELQSAFVDPAKFGKYFIDVSSKLPNSRKSDIRGKF